MGLNINSSIAVSATNSSKNKQTTKTALPQQKPDVFEKKSFNINDAMKTLQSSTYVKNQISEPKFNEEELSKLKQCLTDEPEKWDSVKTLVTTPFLKGKTVVCLASRNKDVLDATIPFAVEPKKNDTKVGKYGDDQVLYLSEIANRYGANKLQEAKPLIKTSLSSYTIKDIIKDPKLDGKINKVASHILDLEKSLGDNLREITFNGENTYDSSEFVIQATTNDDKVNTVLLDKNLKKEAIESMSMYQAKGQTYQIKKVNDFRTNSTSKVRLLVDDSGYSSATHEVRVVKDKSGNVVKREYTAPSEVSGVLDIKSVDPNGNETIISEGKIDKKTGITTVRKNMTSLDGTKTQYLYEDDPQGNRIMDYKITDKQGKVLLNNSSSFEVINENHFVSAKNNQKYDIKVDKHEINVVDINNPKRQVKISIDKQIKGNKKEILKSLKAMPGEELFKLAETTKKLTCVDSLDGSYYNDCEKTINTDSNLASIMHELGHARDFRDVDVSSEENYENTLKKAISNNKELQKTYESERKTFIKAFPDTQRDYIDYFINKSTHYGGELGGLRETVAESNALLTTPKTHDILAMRSQYLQQYFPKTIALLDNVLNKTKA